MSDPKPAFLTVEEAAKVLRIGRTKAYALARQWRTTGGRAGLPVLDLGDVLRVPVARLEELAGTSLDGIANAARSLSTEHSSSTPRPTSAESAPPSQPGASKPSSSSRQRRIRSKSQPALFEPPSSAAS